MPTAFEIVEEARGFRDFFEQNWNLPWYHDKASASVWRHKLLHLIANLPESIFEGVVLLMLDDSSFALRGIGLHMARVRGATRFAPSAVHLMSDPSIHVRALAAAALGQFGDEPGIEALLETKDGEHTEVKKAVVEAFKRLRDVRCIPLLSRWTGRVGENDGLRKLGCEALGAIADDAGMPVLQRILTDETVADDIRGEAARAIGMIGVPEAHVHLVGGLKNERPWIRARCAEGLALARDASSFPLVVPLLAASEPWMVRTLAIEAVARLGGEKALDHVSPLLADKEIQIRSSACVALGIIGTTAAQKALKLGLQDPERVVRAQALEALTRASGQDFGFRIDQHHGTLDPRALDAAVKTALNFEPR